jgi:hypothetical protein
VRGHAARRVGAGRTRGAPDAPRPGGELGADALDADAARRVLFDRETGVVETLGRASLAFWNDRFHIARPMATARFPLRDAGESASEQALGCRT